MNYSEDEIIDFVEQLKGYYNSNKKRISIKKMADEIEIGKSTLEEYLYRGRLPEKNLEKIIVYLDKKDVNIENFNFTNNIKFYQERTEEKNLNKQFDENDSIFNKLLETNESIRDPIHGDITITLLEKSLINLKIFQRLRGISQLGPTHLIYPGATHSRFSHSIGTLFVAEKLVQICNKNYESSKKEESNSSYLVEIKPYAHLLIRLSALLHDLAHVPNGHILEDEGNLFLPQWENETRKKLFEKGSEIYNCIRNALIKFETQEVYCDGICNDLYKLLVKEEYKYPYVKDIVSNTLCADLFDYSQRDAYFCGLSERWGDRFINYFAVLSLKELTPDEKKSSNLFDNKNPVYKLTHDTSEGKLRFVLLTYRYEQDQIDPLGKSKAPVYKPDVISEAIDLLRKRHSLGEKVYYHRTKKAASSMLISAVGSAMEEGKLNEDELFDICSDEDFINKMMGKSERTSRILNCYVRRNLYKPIYQIPYIEGEDTNIQSKILWRTIYEKYRKRNERIKIETQLENKFDLKPGSVSIYCPNKKMNRKLFKALIHLVKDSHVMEDFEVKQFRDISDISIRKEIKIIENKFKSLWSFCVYVDSKQINPLEINNPDVLEFSQLCEDVFNLPNELTISDKTHTESDDIFTKILIDRKARQWDEKHPDLAIPFRIVNELKASAGRPPDKSDEDKYIEHQIEAKVTEFYKSQK
jgi:uncharacterized protein